MPTTEPVFLNDINTFRNTGSVVGILTSAFAHPLDGTNTALNPKSMVALES